MPSIRTPGEPSDQPITMRVTRRERLMIDSEAALSGQSPAQWARDVVLNTLEEQAEERAKPVSITSTGGKG